MHTAEKEKADETISFSTQEKKRGGTLRARTAASPSALHHTRISALRPCPGRGSRAGSWWCSYVDRKDDCRTGWEKKRKIGVWQPTQTAAWAFTGARHCCCLARFV